MSLAKDTLNYRYFSNDITIATVYLTRLILTSINSHPRVTLNSLLFSGVNVAACVILIFVHRLPRIN